MGSATAEARSRPEALSHGGDLARRRLLVVCAAAPVLLGAALLLLFPPTQFGFYPRCPFFTYLHLRCPGCGTTRALAAILRDDLRGAFLLNPLTTIALPFALLYSFRAAADLWRATPHRALRPSPRLIATLVAATVVFGMARNL